jgi:hypothetical protein
MSLAIGNQLSLITSLGVVLAFLAWIYVFKRGFQTGWVRASAIAIVAILVFIMIGLAIGSFTHLIVPNVPPVIITQEALNQSMRHRDRLKDDAIAHLSDQLIALTARLDSIEKRQ